MFLALFLYFIFAITYILAKSVVLFIKPIFFVAIRMIIAGGIIVGYQYAKGQSLAVQKRDYFDFFQIMFFNIFIQYVGEFWSIQYLSAAKVSLFFNLAPFITAILAHILIHERLSYRQWIGLVVGFLGLFPILAGQSDQESFLSHLGFISSAELILLIGIVSGAYSWIVFKRLVVNKQYVPATINGISMIGGGIMTGIASIITESSPLITPPMGYSYLGAVGMSFWYMMWLILMANMFCYNLYGHLLKRYSATFLSLVGFITPLFTAALDWLLLNQSVGMDFFLSMTVITIGLGLFYQDEKRQE